MNKLQISNRQRWFIMVAIWLISLLIFLLVFNITHTSLRTMFWAWFPFAIIFGMSAWHVNKPTPYWLIITMNITVLVTSAFFYLTSPLTFWPYGFLIFIVTLLSLITAYQQEKLASKKTLALWVQRLSVVVIGLMTIIAGREWIIKSSAINLVLFLLFLMAFFLSGYQQIVKEKKSNDVKEINKL